jgi:hypothetical protein
MWKGKIDPWLTRKKNEQPRVARCPQVLRYLPLSSSGVKLNLHQDAFARKTKIFIPSGRPETCHLMDEAAQNSNNKAKLNITSPQPRVSFLDSRITTQTASGGLIQGRTSRQPVFSARTCKFHIPFQKPPPIRSVIVVS